MELYTLLCLFYDLLGHFAHVKSHVSQYSYSICLRSGKIKCPLKSDKQFVTFFLLFGEYDTDYEYFSGYHDDLFFLLNSVLLVLSTLSEQVPKIRQEKSKVPRLPI